MNPRKMLIAFGVVTALSPFIGLPRDILSILLPVLGIGIVAIVLLLIPKTGPQAPEGELIHDTHAT
ncbi:MAG: hypothetical protein KBC16_02340 [Candidatus Pacebacteria bacterium]|nr:hypothetical protein [Candidatus Paceibacterota bacterium]